MNRCALLSFLAASCLAALSPRALGSHNVLVYSFLTDAGRQVSAPTAERPARCLMVRGGFAELGAVRGREKPIAREQVDALVQQALRLNAYHAQPPEEPGDLVIVYHWGCMRPDYVGDGIGTTGQERMTNETQMLALVGGRALDRTILPAERSDILEAARDERYFLIVSAFDRAAHAERREKRLLWRTQMSVPVVGLSLDRAVPMLAAAGAALFGRETPTPRRIAIDVAGVLRLREPHSEAVQRAPR